MSNVEPEDKIVIERTFASSIERVFKALVTPEDLLQWHHAGDGWITPHAEVDLRVGGRISIGYSNADGTQTFEFTATIIELTPPFRLAYRLSIDEIVKDDDRLVRYDLTEKEGLTHLRLEFDIEHLNDKELQRQGWTQHIDYLSSLLSKEPA